MEIKDITKGKWYLQEETDAYTHIVRSNLGKGHETFYIGSSPQYTSVDATANMELLVEAGNVANETGLSPRQLLEQRNELLKACKAIQLSIGMIEHNWKWNYKDAMPKVIEAIRKCEIKTP